MGGFVYVFSNPAFQPGLLKIGKSARDPRDHRRRELETTSVSSPFQVEYFAFCEHKFHRGDPPRSVTEEMSCSNQ